MNGRRSLYSPAEREDNARLSERLLPCPFCGGQAWFWAYVNGWAQVKCLQCHVQTVIYHINHMSDDDLIAIWNRRIGAE